MTDAAGETSDSLPIRILQQEKGILKIAIETDEAWMADGKRAYPVTVDPGVTTPRSPSATTEPAGWIRITHNSFDYTFARNGFGNTTGTNAGTRNLIANAFAPGNGNLLSSTYGNGSKIGYDAYDHFSYGLTPVLTVKHQLLASSLT